MICHVYNIGWRDRGPIKIGVALSPTRRMTALQLSHPYKLQIFCAFVLIGPETAYAIEGEAHHRLRGVRLRGEWFNVTAAEARARTQEIIENNGYRVVFWKPRDLKAETRLTKAVNEFNRVNSLDWDGS